MINPTKVKALEGYKIWIEFEDGVSGEVELSHLVNKGVFQKWTDRAFFEDVKIGPYRAIIWGDGEEIDMCADWAYLEVTGKTVDEIRHQFSHA